MQMPKYYEDAELVNLLDQYLQQDPNRKQNFGILSLIDEDCYKADFIFKWIYAENEFWDSINDNAFILARFNAINSILARIKNQPTNSQTNLQYMGNFVNNFPSYFNAEYFVRKHILQ